MIQINSCVFLIAALLILLLPLDWLAAAVIAAILHELFHILTLYALNGKVWKIEIHCSGCVLETGGLGAFRQFISILAGPIGSLSLLLLCHITPKIAICGLVHGVYNLIPVLPLDGGRLLRLLLYHFCPSAADKVMTMIAVFTCILADFLTVCLWVMGLSGPLPIFLAIGWNIRFLPRKIPCKPNQIKVQ